MDWILSISATLVAMMASWLYGNKTHRAPILALAAIALWVVYDVYNAQWPLLIPCAVNAVIQTRNFFRMRPGAERGR